MSVLIKKLRGASASFTRRMADRRAFASTRDWFVWNYDAAVRVFPGITRRTAPFVVRSRGMSQGVMLRPKSTDGAVFDEIFVRDIYRNACNLAADYQGVIVDLGTNIGLSLRYFGERFPGNPMIGIEPDSANIELARQNVAALNGPIELVHACIADKTGQAMLCRTDQQFAYFIEVEGGEKIDTDAVVLEREPVEMLDMPTLLDRHADGQRVRLLKCDIEGSERELFRDCAGWIDRIDVLMVEVHGAYTAEIFQEDLRRNGSRLELVELTTNVTHSMLLMKQPATA